LDGEKDMKGEIVNIPKVSIIILNWNGWRDTIECLESLYQITYQNYEVIVVDNGSEDESIEKIKEYCEGKISVESKFFEYSPENKPIKIIEYTREVAEAGGGREKEIVDLPSNRKLIIIKNKKNYGFAEGNNIGIKYALKALNSDYVMLLNNDTVVDNIFLDELVKVAGSDDKIGIIGPKVNYYDKSNKIFSVGGKINWWTGKNTALQSNLNQIREVDYVSGCALMIKKDALNKIGLFSSEYFLYAEELDYCVRTNRQGFKVFNYPRTTIWHKISASAESKIKMYYRTRNRFIFMKKFLSHPKFLFFIIWTLTVDFAIETLMLIYNRDFDLYKSYLRGLFDGLFLRKGLHK
jgi:GT2 family glycosyltransferase